MTGSQGWTDGPLTRMRFVPYLWVSTFQPLPGTIFSEEFISYLTSRVNCSALPDVDSFLGGFAALADISTCALQFFGWSAAELKAHLWWWFLNYH